jgi:alpha-tubulin suppressor-like RCC1 family protein
LACSSSPTLPPDGGGTDAGSDAGRGTDAGSDAGPIADAGSPDAGLPDSGLAVDAGVEAVSTSGSHTCALVRGGVWCWGSNGSGQLGNDSGTDSPVPVPVIGLGSGVDAISAGDSHTCALASGAVYCWGSNVVGQLGVPNSIFSSPVPLPVTGLDAGVVAVSAGYRHSCALLDGGGALCWGSNFYGQLGDGTGGVNTDQYTPTQVVGLTGGAQQISAGSGDTCALVSGGVQCWGDGTYGQLGNNQTSAATSPVQVSGMSAGTGWTAVSMGDHGCAIRDGGLMCWGYNGTGQIGDGTGQVAYVPTQPIEMTAGVQSVSASTAHTCAVVSGGAWCWGSNVFGELGIGDAGGPPISTPQPVSGLGAGLQQIGSSSDHTCALVRGTIWCWGHNGNGQLGNDSGTDSPVPVPVSAPW